MVVKNLLAALLTTAVVGQNNAECDTISSEHWVDISGGEKAFKETGIGASWGTDSVWKVCTTRLYDNAF